MKLCLTGGGTMGAVIPLLSINDELSGKNGYELFWIGTKHGIERELIAKEKIKYFPISSGKLRRYFSLKNLIDPFFVLAGFFEAYQILRTEKPDVVLSCGGYVSVPAVFAAKLLGIKITIHQQDVVTGLANKIMGHLADRITVTFESSVSDFPKEKALVTGNPVRNRIFSGNKAKANKIFELSETLPVLLVLGGSLGSVALNDLVEQSYAQLKTFCQVIHVTGKKASAEKVYKQYEYLNEALSYAYAAADLIVSRAGFVTITEMVALKKPMVLIPIPNNQQEKNAELLSEKKAAVYVSQSSLTAEKFVKLIKNLITDKAKLSELAGNSGKLNFAVSAESYLEKINLMKLH